MTGCIFQYAAQICDEIDREREDDRRILLRTDFNQSLKIPQLQGRRFLLNDLGRRRQPVGRGELAFGVDDLRAPLASGSRVRVTAVENLKLAVEPVSTQEK